jgi:TPR repeat protein
MYANGKGVIKDGIKAHMWLSLAISSGCKNAIDKRDNIALDLTDDEIDEAGRMANEWRAQRP